MYKTKIKKKEKKKKITCKLTNYGNYGIVLV